MACEVANKPMDVFIYSFTHSRISLMIILTVNIGSSHSIWRDDDEEF